MAAAANPFGSAFAGQNGAHLVAAFNSARVPDSRLERTAHQPGVTATAGPFAEATVNITSVTGPRSQGPSQPNPVPPGPLTVVGRSSPGGAVDRLNLWLGHWATGPGQIVVDLPSSEHIDPRFLGSTISISGGQSLTVVGVAYSVSQSAGAWVAPAEIGALRPRATQMLYRFASAATAADIGRDQATITAGLPRGTLISAKSYLTVEQNYSSLLGGVYGPLLLAFGIIALAVAVLIVANVIGGAVVSGYRHIGVLKATGYTPDQVTAVYLVMVGAPSLGGCVLGVAAGTAAAGPFAALASQGLVPPGAAINARVDVLTLVGLLVLIAVTALGAALRARRLPAARAISAGSAPGSGRAVRVQRLLAGTRLPRAVSLGLGLPFARPARSALTVAAVALGVLTVTMGIGLTSTAISYGDLAESHGGDQVSVMTGHPGQAAATPSTAATEALLRSLPGAVHVDASVGAGVRLVGSTQSILVNFVDNEPAGVDDHVVRGHWIDGPYQAVASPGFLNANDLSVGSRLTLDMGGKPATVTIVGENWDDGNDAITADWRTLTVLAPGKQASAYGVQLASGASVSAYLAAVRQASPGLDPQANDKTNAGTEIVATTATMFTVLLAIVAALGVFNTVVLSTRERRRDLGMLKSIGMTPSEVTGMMVASMAELGVAGTVIGLPLGILAHRLVIAAITHSGTLILPAYMVDVWSAPLVAALAFSGL
ncbi:MAG TPA: FtsX-like permease family protein, partial [Trebonia sp.]|nr:FtsX-like permease family protein [Trebonia sp.]